MTDATLRGLLALVDANYPTYGRDPETTEARATLWALKLGGYSDEAVARAVDEYISGPARQAPVIGEILALLRPRFTHAQATALLREMAGAYTWHPDGLSWERLVLEPRFGGAATDAWYACGSGPGYERATGANDRGWQLYVERFASAMVDALERGRTAPPRPGTLPPAATPAAELGDPTTERRVALMGQRIGRPT